MIRGAAIAVGFRAIVGASAVSGYGIERRPMPLLLSRPSTLEFNPPRLNGWAGLKSVPNLSLMMSIGDESSTAGSSLLLVRTAVAPETMQASHAENRRLFAEEVWQNQCRWFRSHIQLSSSQRSRHRSVGSTQQFLAIPASACYKSCSAQWGGWRGPSASQCMGVLAQTFILGARVCCSCAVPGILNRGFVSTI